MASRKRGPAAAPVNPGREIGRIGVHKQINVIDDEKPAESVSPMLEQLGVAPPPKLVTTNAPRLTHLTANVKGGVDLDLAPLTAVVGPNRSQKTAVLDAARLALTGRHPIGERGIDLMRLSAGGDLRVVGAFGEANEVTFYVEGDRRSASRPAFTTFLDAASLDHIIPTDAIGSLLELGTTKAREEVFRRFGNAKGVLSPPPGLNDKQRGLWDELLQYGATDDGLAAAPEHIQLATLAESLRHAKLARGREVRAIEEQIAVAKKVIGAAPPSAEQLEALRRTLHDLQEWTAATQRRATAQALLVSIEQEAMHFRREAAEFEARPQGARVDVEALRSELEKRQKAEEELALAHRSAVEDRNRFAETTGVIVRAYNIGSKANPPRCPFCGGADIEELKRQIDLRNALDQTKLVEIDRLQAAWQAATETTKAVLIQLKDAQAPAPDRQRFIEWAARINAARAQANEVLTTLAEPPADLQQQIAEAWGALDMAEKANRAAQTLPALRTALAAETQIEADFAILEKEAARILQEQLGAVAKAASDAVSHYMPSGFSAQLVLNDDGREVCMWTVTGKDGEPHGRFAASGSEWAALTIALGCAWTEGAPIRVLLLDDGELGKFDPAALKGLLTRVAELVQAGTITQAIVAWSREDEIPDGWVKVRR